MNVASLELCRELYELSGWYDTDYIYYSNGGEYSGAYYHRNMVFQKPKNMPAYDLGYLLRKLNRHFYATQKAELRRLGTYLLLVDDPENKLVEYAIQLFKQSVLTRRKS